MIENYYLIYNNPNIINKPIYTEPMINLIILLLQIKRQFMREDKEFNNKNKISILSSKLIAKL